MTSFVFKENNEKLGYGMVATHWTNKSMHHCTCIRGKFSTNPIEAAKEYFFIEDSDCDGNNRDFWDGEDLIAGKELVIRVYGLVLIGKEYYWTNEIKTFSFSINIVSE